MANNTKIKIENSKPLPSIMRAKYPFIMLQIGESFFVPYSETNKKTLLLVLYGSANDFKKRNANFFFTARRTSNGIRIWRTKSQTDNYQYAIEKNIPILEKIRGTRYPIALLEVTESFFVKVHRSRLYSTQQKLIHLVNQHINYQAGKNKKFTSRLYDNGVRVWRIK